MQLMNNLHHNVQQKHQQVWHYDFEIDMKSTKWNERGQLWHHQNAIENALNVDTLFYNISYQRFITFMMPADDTHDESRYVCQKCKQFTLSH